jgi:short-subunit dehydrogenase
MNNYFKEKVVIVTGASAGIGMAIAKEFARSGSNVVLASRSEAKIFQLEKELKDINLNALAIKTDVSCEEDCRRLIDETIKRFGKIDILINNAGLSMMALFIESDLKVLRKLMDVNFWGTVNCTKYALPHLISSKGSLVGVSSVAGFHGLPMRSGYSASKFAMHGFLETIRIENLKNGLHVLLIAPGFTSTDIRKNALLADGNEQGESQMNETKMMSPEYVAKCLIKGIRKKKRNIILSWEGKLTALLQRIFPNLVDSVYYNAFSKDKGSVSK